MMILLPFIPPKRQAEAAAPVLKLVGGELLEQVVIGIGEKAGMKYADVTAEKRAIQRWNLDYYEQQKKWDDETKATYEAILQKMNDRSKIVPMPSKPGYGKILVNTAGFITGLDILYEGYKAFNDAKNMGKMANAIVEANYLLENGEAYISYKGVYMNRWGTVKTCYSPGGYNAFSCQHLGIFKPTDDPSYPYWQPFSNFDSTGVGYFKQTGQDATTIYFEATATGRWNNESTTPTTKTSTFSIPITAATPSEIVIPPSSLPLPSSLPIAPIMPSIEASGIVAPLPQNVPEGMPEEIAIEVPLTEPGLEPMPEQTPITEDLKDPLQEPLPEEPPPTGGNPDDPIGDKKIDWEKLKSTFGAFTTKFPFSLPWDAERAFNAVFPDPSDIEKPEWEFKIKKPDGTYHFQKLTIDEEFEKYIEILRKAILLLFNISLIYAIRQWFGGAS